jgi:ABC-type multidrug transport system fused ATPase/permease subunit
LEWPETPTIEISNVSARYREGLPLILNDISIKTAAGKRLGIVGRTGAGKSSIIQVLFRLVEP